MFSNDVLLTDQRISNPFVSEAVRLKQMEGIGLCKCESTLSRCFSVLLGRERNKTLQEGISDTIGDGHFGSGAISCNRSGMTAIRTGSSAGLFPNARLSLSAL